MKKVKKEQTIGKDRGKKGNNITYTGSSFFSFW
jgi:hypothetical protein